MVLVLSPTELVQPLPVRVRSGLGALKRALALGCCAMTVSTAVVHPVREAARKPQAMRAMPLRLITRAAFIAVSFLAASSVRTYTKTVGTGCQKLTSFHVVRAGAEPGLGRLPLENLLKARKTG